MMKTVMACCVGAALVLAAAGGLSAQPGASANAAVLEAAQAALREKTIQSGTLDIYDAGLNEVRNLQRIDVSDEVSEADGVYTVLADYRDMNNGDIVTLEVVLAAEGDGYKARDIRIKSVKALKQDESLKDKTYSDDEIRDFMRQSLEKQGQFSDGKIMLFDEDAARMRNLLLLELKAEVRRLGIFYNCRGEFKDADSGERLGVDVAVENKDGQLTLQALRIRNVRKAPAE
ncbi:MAG TPA: hypothetical protein PLT76_04715 [Candidatus Omnitrophota bacterium]|nr:hypothetical protein [Candidatus Omnitrophota bacterium]HQO58002.1 hypothetical protein [Candidatus Omnitrophota bacterium]